MNREELFQLHDALSSASKEIMKRKNADYSKEDPFGNFMLSEALQTCTAEYGIINRMGDKLSRLVSVLAKGAQVKDESMRDTIMDLINYSVLLYGVYINKNDLAGKDKINPKKDSVEYAGFEKFQGPVEKRFS